jgi:hypothetical protein
MEEQQTTTCENPDVLNGCDGCAFSAVTTCVDDDV